jgi:2-C-methyl-D-erythritol 2,4-cyclodiphosphate synthase
VTYRCGLGFDVHPFAAGTGTRLVLGGITIPDEPGLAGHSDADVVCHALADALLGSLCLGDLGTLFPASEARWAGYDSMLMLHRVVTMVREEGWRVGNADITIVAERPRLAPYCPTMAAGLADALTAPVSVKAKRAEGLGALGRCEGIACWAVATCELP